MNAYEKLGAFYLGRRIDPDGGESAGSAYLLYDSKDLTTHAVCVGMTGSGKTGLCVALLEEAALDGIPALAIDPKGDLGNLLLTFPDLAPASFEPWVDADDAAREGIAVPELARRQAELWRSGLAEWDQSGERIARLREAVDMRIYTPGSQAGLPISILGSLGAPPSQIVDDADLLRDRVTTTATSLLTLLGIDADPIRSREHILLSTLLDRAWRRGEGLDLGGLIRAVQEPPLERIGVVELETFYPESERFELAMQINSLLAAPGFQTWLEGEPLDVGGLLYAADSRPRLAIVSIAHLSASERMFFVSLLLNEVLSWVRTRPGTSALRAILYMDEIFGYMPPVAEPPSKRPLLTLLKQARAYGLGIVLATQNPVDLDYKGLSNTGTWLLGRLQTERDKLRLLDGLQGARTGEGGFDRQRLESLLSGLGKRTFLLHNVHEPEPVLFRSRWAMSYLRGPLTRDQIRRLVDPHRQSAAPAQPPAPATPAPPPARAVTPATQRPIVAPDVSEVFLPIDEQGETPTYTPGVIGVASIHFTDRKRTREASKRVVLVHPGAVSDRPLDWGEALPADLDPDRLGSEPAADARFDPFVAGPAPSARDLQGHGKDLAEHLYRQSTYRLFESSALGEVSQPGESERDFRIRLAELARERRDREIEALRQSYSRRLESLESRVRAAAERLDREQAQSTSSRLDSAISMGTTLLSAFLGRRRLSSATLSTAGRAARGLSRSSKEALDVRQAEDTLESWKEKLADLERQLEDEVAALEERFDPLREELGTVELRPRRSDVRIEQVALAWLPYAAPAGGPRRWRSAALTARNAPGGADHRSTQ